MAIANDGVTSAKIAAGAVTTAKLSPSGGTSGKVLKHTGTAVAWGDDSGLTLPYSESGSTSGQLFEIVATSGTAIHAVSSSMGYGILAEGGPNVGVYGKASGANAGVWGAATGSGGLGVYGIHNATENRGYLGSPTNGALGHSASGTGVKAESVSGTGLYAESSSGRAIQGFTGGDVAIYGRATGTTGSGVYGKHWTSGNYGYLGDATYGVYGRYGNTGPSGQLGGVGFGVQGLSTDEIGVLGHAATTGTGVRAFSTQGRGLHAATGTGNAIYAEGAGTTRTKAVIRALNTNPTNGMVGYFSNSSGYATVHFANAGAGEVLYLQANGGTFIKAVNSAENDRKFLVDYAGNVRADGTFASPAADFAEMLPARDGLEPGDVLAISTDGRLMRSVEAYQASVVGVYSTKPGFLGGSSDDADPAGKVPLAVIGVVPVKASAENGAIRPGDMLVASSTPGHAMRCGDRPPAGRIVGKALTPLASGTGVVTMIVTLQ